MKFDGLKLAAFVKDSNDPAFLRLVDAINEDQEWNDLRQIAYALATIEHETDAKFLPLEEYGKGRGKEYGKPAANGKVYYGRGFVQLTHYKNYLRMGRIVGVDLVNHPELAGEFHTAYEIASVGMRQGLFTGKRLDDYINESKCDYLNARRIINGNDRAARIEGLAARWERALRVSEIIEEVAAQPVPPAQEAVNQPEPAAGLVTEQKTTTQSESTWTLDGLQSQADKIDTVVTSFTKRADTVKAFRLAMGMKGLGVVTMLGGFWQHARGYVWAGLGIVVLFAVLYFLRQCYLGGIQLKKQ